jgi:aerobic-type carbon monoxide dehydrogenase small subunit (CoxS/CutS family)
MKNDREYAEVLKVVKVDFWLNGKEVLIETSPGEMLSDVLRYHLGLTGTKIGCDELECGTCTGISSHPSCFQIS